MDHDKITTNPMVQRLREKKLKIIGCVGRFVELKRYNDVLEAARILLMKRKDLHFVLVGGRGDIEKMKCLAEDINIHEHVTFTGEVKDVLSYMKGFDIFLHASSSEGLSNVIMEAMLLGKPIIATNVGGTSDLIIDTMNGILIPPFRPDRIVESVNRLLDDPELQKKMSINNINRIKEFSTEKMVSHVNQMYTETVF